MKNLKILVEQHPDGYVAYSLGIQGVVVGQGETYEEALADVESAVLFHVETFGEELRSAEPTAPNLDLQKAPRRGRRNVARGQERHRRDDPG